MIEASHLTKRYGTTLAVDDLSFEVRPGVVTGFLGPNGAGKSTTMRLVMGLDSPNTGGASVNGKPYVELRRPMFEVGALLEAKAIHGGRSAYNHLLCLAQSNGIGRRRITEVLELVGLGDVAKRRAGGFSMGMGQRLGIATALLGDPPTLLFDEPGNGLDPEGIRWIRQLLQSLAAEGRTVFVSSHLMSEMAITAEQLIVIGRGRMIADTSVAEFVRRSSGGYVRVRTPEVARMTDLLTRGGAVVDPAEQGSLAVTGLEITAVGELASREGIVLHELSPQAASLEEAFMQLTRESVEFHAGPEGGEGESPADGAPADPSGAPADASGAPADAPGAPADPSGAPADATDQRTTRGA
ncbi:MAG: ABC transporter ATP-binding protein [Acidimicrobiales bacterium]